MRLKLCMSSRDCSKLKFLILPLLNNAAVYPVGKSLHTVIWETLLGFTGKQYGCPASATTLASSHPEVPCESLHQLNSKRPSVTADKNWLNIPWLSQSLDLILNVTFLENMFPDTPDWCIYDHVGDCVVEIIWSSVSNLLLPNCKLPGQGLFWSLYSQYNPFTYLVNIY